MKIRKFFYLVLYLSLNEILIIFNGFVYFQYHSSEEDNYVQRTRRVKKVVKAKKTNDDGGIFIKRNMAVPRKASGRKKIV